MAKSKFDLAFAAHRKSGDRDFDFEGDETHKKGKYTTALKGDDKPAARSAAPKPAAKATPKASESKPAANSSKMGLGDTISDTVGTYVGKAAKAVTGSDAAQILAGSLTGRKRAYTEEDFSPETLEQTRSAARQLRADARAGKTNIDRDNRGKLKRGFGQLDYAHYGKENNVNLHSTDQKHAAASSFGRARIDYDAKGNPTSLTDAYGFNNKNRKAQIERYKNIADTAEGATRITPIPGVLARGAAKAGTIAYDFASDLLNQGKPSRSNPKRKATWDDTKENLVANIGTAIMGDKEVPVKINLKDKDEKAEGGAVKKYATGGEVKKPYKPTPGDLNEKSGGDQEFENRKYMEEQRKKGKPAPSKPKYFAKGGMVGSRADGCATKGKTKCKMR
jgi:hypothetical protein